MDCTGEKRILWRKKNSLDRMDVRLGQDRENVTLFIE